MKSLLQANSIPKWIVIAILLISFTGFLDTTYLTAQHYSSGSIECNIFEGCDEVTTSQYSKIGPVPIALMGAMYYLIIFIASLIYLDKKNPRIIYPLFLFTIIGLLFSLWLTYLQFFLV